ncbi:MAG: NADH-quinone oxidoreductase subunit C [Verrucomicrobia bacterium 21-51-4]|nr:MAG: NADH-quinone oxidoreductase subunit C [Verrucomicrobia bacterium 21-51-4]HQU08675.1 NADH-quinone oxidoreductase subunit C [Opitutales bacterium]
MSLLQLLQQFPSAHSRPTVYETAWDVPAKDILAFLKALRDEGGFDMLVDLTAIDWGMDCSPRFSVVYHLLSTKAAEYVRVVVACENDLEPTMPSAVSLFDAADWHEREAYDMFGVRFEGHPNLTRILMWEGYPGHPLRKDFPLAGVETPFPAADTHASTGKSVEPAPMMGGPFVAPLKAHMSTREPRALDQSWTEKHPKPVTTFDDAGL